MQMVKMVLEVSVVHHLQPDIACELRNHCAVECAVRNQSAGSTGLYTAPGKQTPTQSLTCNFVMHSSVTTYKSKFYQHSTISVVYNSLSETLQVNWHYP